MRDRLAEFGDAVEVVLVTFTTPDELESYLARHGLPFATLLDADRRVYRSYGFGRATAGRIWSPGVLRTYARLVRRDGIGVLERPTEDTRQLGGDVVIAPDGTLAWAFWSEGPDDRPSVDDLLVAIEATR